CNVTLTHRRAVLPNTYVALIFLSFFFVSVMAHCRERGDEMIVGDLSHIHLAGVHSATVTTLGDGTFDLNQLISKIRHGYPDPHYPRSRLVCITVCVSHSKLPSVADKFVLAVHMDRTRVMNAAVALGIQPSAILQHCHSVSVCLSKGLGAPVGTMLGGSKDFIQRAVRVCKALGGGLRQSGVLAAAGKIALSDMIGRLEEVHRKARSFAQALLQCDPPLYQLDLNTMSPAEFCEQMAGGVKVLMFPHVGGTVRAVWHLGISEEDTQLAILKAQFVAQQHKPKSNRAS
uniref:Threonine aldolase 1 n=1 Tax=Sinocyclocheilus anshuiensis TaxID=1608454 RepID=A0A671LHV6_9TELE